MNPILVKTRLDLIKMLPPGTIGAEIGVWRGYFSVAILETPVQRLYLVDPWCRQPKAQYDDSVNEEDQTKNFDETVANVSGFGDRCVIIRGFSSVIACNDHSIPPLDWVYIDGNHAYDFVYQDLDLWSIRLKPYGIIMGHDFVESPRADKLHIGVAQAVNEFCQDKDWKITHLSDDEFPSYRLERV